MNSSTLQQSETRYRRLFETAHDGILIVDPVTRQILDVNPFLESFLGYTHQEIVGKELYEIGVHADAAASKAAFRQLQQTGHIRYEDLPLQTKGGQAVAVECVSNLYAEDGVPVIQCNIRDITARKRTEAALQATEARLAHHAVELEKLVAFRNTELRLSNDQKERMAYSIAHELRAPLRSMQGFAHLLVQEHSANLDPVGHDYANFINESAQAMDRLLTGVLAVGQDGPAPGVQAADASNPATPNLPAGELTLASGLSVPVRLRLEPRPDGIVRIWVEDAGIGASDEFHVQGGVHAGVSLVQSWVERLGGCTGWVAVPGRGGNFWADVPQKGLVAERPFRAKTG